MAPCLQGGNHHKATTEVSRWIGSGYLSSGEDVQLAQKLVRLLDEHGITGFWVSEEEGEKLAQIWQEDAWITEQEGDGSLSVGR